MPSEEAQLRLSLARHIVRLSNSGITDRDELRRRAIEEMFFEVGWAGGRKIKNSDLAVPNCAGQIGVSTALRATVTAAAATRATTPIWRRFDEPFPHAHDMRGGNSWRDEWHARSASIAELAGAARCFVSVLD